MTKSIITMLALTAMTSGCALQAQAPDDDAKAPIIVTEADKGVCTAFCEDGVNASVSCQGTCEIEDQDCDSGVQGSVTCVTTGVTAECANECVCQTPPSAAITYLRAIGSTCVGPNVGFSAMLSTTVCGPIVEYRWDFDGNGTIDQTSTNGFQSHHYGAASGNRTACVTVEDSDGNTDTACTNFTLC